MVDKFHVIEFIDDELEARGWTRVILACRMGGDAPRNLLALELLETRDSNMLLGDEMAEGLARAFGTGSKIWTNLDASWRACNSGDAKGKDSGHG
jgi:plasmid maintenance system antidote protein VapI